jgi:hypothetical protein
VLGVPDVLCINEKGESGIGRMLEMSEMPEMGLAGGGVLYELEGGVKMVAWLGGEELFRVGVRGTSRVGVRET